MSKSKTIEERYQTKDPHAHILSIPDTYVGSVTLDKMKLHYFDDETNKIVQGEKEISLGLYKIVDEILVNCTDQTIREPIKCNVIKINIDKTTGIFKIFNNGSTIPIALHAEHNMYVPQLIFSELRSSENFDDKDENEDDGDERLTGGKNGFGAKLTNIFSKEFTIEVVDAERGLKYIQRCSNNMYVIGAPVITKSKEPSSVSISFLPDYQKFGMTGLTDDMYSFLKRRVYDIAGSTNEKVKVYFNDSLLPIKSFIDYVRLYYESDTHVIHEKINDRWQIAVIYDSDPKCKQVSFVNNVSTYAGGSHYEYISKQITSKIVEKIKLKKSTNKLDVKPATIKACLTIFINCSINKPKFNSQIKELLNKKVDKFSKGIKTPCEIPDSFIEKICKTKLINEVVDITKFKEERETNKLIASKSDTGGKGNVIRGIPKLSDAELASHKTRSTECSLILTEGDSAKASALQGIANLNDDLYGVFPLKGKLLNVREATAKQLSENEEILAIMKIMGLDLNCKYTTDKEFKTLRYGRIVIFSDQDDDGYHIKGLVMNFIHYYWANLMKRDGFIACLPSPRFIIRKPNGDEVAEFFTETGYLEWVKTQTNTNSFKIKYLKGLGSLERKDICKIFSNYANNIIQYKWNNTPCQNTVITPDDSETGNKRGKKTINLPAITDVTDDAITLAFSKKRADDRKNWLEYYDKNLILDTTIKLITYDDSIHKEMKHFSNSDNIRSIPNLYDGFKPSQRKVMFSAFKKNLINEIKVAEFSGYISENSAYHHGEASLHGTIINMAQIFVGANNVALLQDIGQFGSRVQGGKDSASPRYIFTRLEKITKKIFIDDDEYVLNYLVEDGKSIEPDVYYPIIPMLLVNGANGIGTGYSTDIPSFNITDIIANIKLLMENKPQFEMIPWYMGFEGIIEKNAKGKFECYGKAEIINENTLKITELPIGVWTTDYKVEMEELEQLGEIANVVSGKNTHLINFVLTFENGKLQELQKSGDIDKKLKLKQAIGTTNMHVYKNNKIVRYETANDILADFYVERLRMYDVRQKFMINKLLRDLDILKYTIMFIKENIAKTIVVTELTEDQLYAILKTKQYPELGTINKPISYDYLTELKIRAFTTNQINKLEKQYAEKMEYVNIYSAKTPKQLWNEELDALLDEYSIYYNYRLEVFKQLASGNDESSSKTSKPTKPPKNTKK